MFGVCGVHVEWSWSSDIARSSTVESHSVVEIIWSVLFPSSVFWIVDFTCFRLCPIYGAELSLHLIMHVRLFWSCRRGSSLLFGSWGYSASSVQTKTQVPYVSSTFLISPNVSEPYGITMEVSRSCCPSSLFLVICIISPRQYLLSRRVVWKRYISRLRVTLLLYILSNLGWCWDGCQFNAMRMG